MGKVIEIVGYIFGGIVIIAGIPFITESILNYQGAPGESGPYVGFYPIIGPIIIGIGILICYGGYRSGRRKKVKTRTIYLIILE